MAPGIVAAQQASSPTADSSAATLPEIRVIGITPLPPPRPAARPAASAATPAATVAAPAEPGAIDRDKVPSNIQTLSPRILIRRRHRACSTPWRGDCPAWR